MKKNFLPVFLIMVTVTLFAAACNSGASGDAHTIKMRMNNGDTFNHNIKMNMLMNTTAMGQSMDMKMNMDAAIGFKVANGTADNKELAMTYNQMKMGMDMGKLQQTSINTDSIMNESTSKFIGKKVLLTLSPKNEITNVSGFDAIANSSDNPMAKEMMEKMFSKEQLNSMLGMMFSMYPGKPVKVGEVWESSTTMNMANIDMKVKIKYKLVGVKNGLADIDVDGIIDGKGKMNQGGMEMDMAMNGTQKGILTIKMDDGYLKDGAYKMDVKAEMEMMGQKIPMAIKADYTLKGN